MRTVLCFGDSNTWGYDPETDERFPPDIRWPGQLAKALGENWTVIEEGLNGRTTCLDSPLAPGKNGLSYLIPCLESHAPLDVAIVFLGTNDLANRYAMAARDIARAAGRLAGVVASSTTGPGKRPTRPILVCPPQLGDIVWGDDWSGAPAKAVSLSQHFQTVAAELGVELVDLSSVVRYSPIDGIHLDAEGHSAVAQEAERTLRRLFD